MWVFVCYSDVFCLENGLLLTEKVIIETCLPEFYSKKTGSRREVVCPGFLLWTILNGRDFVTNVVNVSLVDSQQKL